MLFAAAFNTLMPIWFLCWLIGGPILCIIAVVLLVQAFRQHTLRPARLIPPLLCLAVVGVWSVGFWRISNAIRPLVFERVADDDEHLAVSFMRQHPPDTDIEVSGFRYPYFELSPSGPLRVKHHDGVVSIRIPAGPGILDYLVYVSPGSSMPYTPPTAETDGIGAIVKPLTKHWYYAQIVGI